MTHSIILSSCLLGSVYLMAKSLDNINRQFLGERRRIDNKKIPCELFFLNGLTFVVSSSIFIGGCFTLLRV